MSAGGWAEEKSTCLYIHMRYSQVFVASLNLTVIRIAKLQAGKQYYILLERDDSFVSIYASSPAINKQFPYFLHTSFHLALLLGPQDTRIHGWTPQEHRNDCILHCLQSKDLKLKKETIFNVKACSLYCRPNFFLKSCTLDDTTDYFNFHFLIHFSPNSDQECKFRRLIMKSVNRKERRHVIIEMLYVKSTAV